MTACNRGEVVHFLLYRGVQFVGRRGYKVKRDVRLFRPEPFVQHAYYLVHSGINLFFGARPVFGRPCEYRQLSNSFLETPVYQALDCFASVVVTRPCVLKCSARVPSITVGNNGNMIGIHNRFPVETREHFITAADISTHPGSSAAVMKHLFRYMRSAQMPNLPTYGWFDRCEDCDIITSRLMTIRHKKKHRTIYVCRLCRFNLLNYLWDDFKSVIVTDESAAHIRIKVAR